VNYTTVFNQIREKCHRGRAGDIDAVVSMLNADVDLPTTKAIDRYLGEVTTRRGIRRLKHYLFHGTQMQRNYCTLFFARRNDWAYVNRAFEKGLIDAIQAYSR
jgi:hypothetical protein